MSLTWDFLNNQRLAFLKKISAKDLGKGIKKNASLARLLKAREKGYKPNDTLLWGGQNHDTSLH
jgi:hypothetical protein